MSSQNSNSAHTVSCGNEPLGHRLERLYSVCNDPRYIHPDPLETILPFRRIEDREIAALLASSLAYGRVNQILKSIRCVLEIMGDSPRRYLETASPEQLERDFAGFKHRFHTGEDLAQLFRGVQRALERHGSLEKCFLSGFPPGIGRFSPHRNVLRKNSAVFFRLENRLFCRRRNAAAHVNVFT